jgi:enoyl-CoA hydratase
MSTNKVLTERHGRTWLVTINRPEKRNCADADVAQGLFEAAEEFKRDDSLDVLVLTGAGDRAFCAGADLTQIPALNGREGAYSSGPMGISRLTDVEKPTIAAVEGYSTAGGLELACWCDFRIVSTTAQFGVLNRRWGVPLVDGGTQKLPQIVGMGNAMYLIITGALINADNALRMGLAQELVPAGQALPRALEIAETLSTYPQPAMRADKQAAIHAFRLEPDEGLRFEVRAHSESNRDPAMAQWLERFAKGERPTPITPPPAP